MPATLGTARTLRRVLTYSRQMSHRTLCQRRGVQPPICKPESPLVEQECMTNRDTRISLRMESLWDVIGCSRLYAKVSLARVQLSSMDSVLPQCFVWLKTMYLLFFFGRGGVILEFKAPNVLWTEVLMYWYTECKG